MTFLLTHQHYCAIFSFQKYSFLGFEHLLRGLWCFNNVGPISRLSIWRDPQGRVPDIAPAVNSSSTTISSGGTYVCTDRDESPAISRIGTDLAFVRGRHSDMAEDLLVHNKRNPISFPERDEPVRTKVIQSSRCQPSCRGCAVKYDNVPRPTNVTTSAQLRAGFPFNSRVALPA